MQILVLKTSSTLFLILQLTLILSKLKEGAGQKPLSITNFFTKKMMKELACGACSWANNSPQSADIQLFRDHPMSTTPIGRPIQFALKALLVNITLSQIHQHYQKHTSI
jgi:hypothetical protein